MGDTGHWTGQYDSGLSGRRLTLSLLLPVALLLTGCASLRLHSPTRDAQGQAAVKAWANANPLGVIESSLDNYHALLDEQLATSKEGRMAAADQILLGLAAQDNGRPISTGLMVPIDVRMLRLTGDLAAYQSAPDNAQQRATLVNDAFGSYKALKVARSRAALFNDAAKARFSELRRYGGEVSSCSELADGTPTRAAIDAWATAYNRRRPNRGPFAQAALSQAIEKCSTSAQETGGVDVLLDSALKSAKASNKPVPELYAAMLAARDARRQLTENQTKFAAQRNDFRTARLNFERVLYGAPSSSATSATAATPPAASASAAGGNQFTDAITKLQAAFQKLRDTNDKYSLKLFSEARVAAIDDLFNSLLAPKAADDPDATARDRAVQAINSLLTTEQDWKLTQEKAREILGRPLQAQQQVDALQAAALGRSIDADEAQLDLLEQRVSIQDKMAEHLASAYGFLHPLDSNKQPKQLSHPERSLSESLYGKVDPNTGKKAFDRVDGDERRRLISGAGHFLYVVGDLTAELDAIRYKQDALDRATELTVSENHVRQWEALIGNNVDLLATWAGGGVKEETISRGVNALLLFWIGLGVN